MREPGSPDGADVCVGGARDVVRVVDGTVAPGGRVAVLGGRAVVVRVVPVVDVRVVVGAGVGGHETVHDWNSLTSLAVHGRPPFCAGNSTGRVR